MAEDSKNDGIGSFEIGGEPVAEQHSVLPSQRHPSYDNISRIMEDSRSYLKEMMSVSCISAIGIMGWSDQVPKGEPRSIADGMRIPTRP